MSIVYSTGMGRICPGCRRPVADCVCKGVTGRTRPTDGSAVRVSRETKGRGGKGVTLVTGLPLNDADLALLATQLKRCCGSGGTVRDGVIEIQGEHRDTLVTRLQQLGYAAKRAGG